jgi:hypothetical protein
MNKIVVTGMLTMSLNLTLSFASCFFHTRTQPEYTNNSIAMNNSCPQETEEIKGENSRSCKVVEESTTINGRTYGLGSITKMCLTYEKGGKKFS